MAFERAISLFSKRRSAAQVRQSLDTAKAQLEQREAKAADLKMNITVTRTRLRLDALLQMDGMQKKLDDTNRKLDEIMKLIKAQQAGQTPKPGGAP